jgi:hypothetical protein
MSFGNYLSEIGNAEGYDAKTDGVKFSNKNKKSFFLLYEDLEECLAMLWENLPDIDEQFEGDWSYNEPKFRKSFGDVLERCSDNTVIAGLKSQTSNAVKILGLYAAYLSKEDPNIDEHIFITPENINNITRYNPKYLSFSGWLKRKSRNGREEKYSKKTIASYHGAIAKILSGISGRDLLQIRDKSEFEDAKNILEQHQEYIRMNKDGNNMYSAAVKLYSEFLENFDQKVDMQLVIEGFKSTLIFRSILSKPFVILTGASGTGKTKLAESLVEYYADGEKQNSALVAVGADWADSRSVLGFVNHLRTFDDLPVYQSTPVLDLMLRALNKPDLPHFLILDEMNLSHVERYFADFLSAMEQKQGQLHLHSESSSLPRFEGDGVRVPPILEYPGNLFVIGTVNVDETTYMFSPKVLDRSNVIEFKVEGPKLEAFLGNPGAYPDVEPAAAGQAEAFLALAKRTRTDGLDALPANVSSNVIIHVMKIFDVMQKGRFEFAYRSSIELIRFLQVSRHLAPDKAEWDASTWQSDLDTQILQKLLPRLHGSVGRIGELLGNLAGICHDGGNSGTITMDEALELNSNDADVLFKRSLEKLQAMIRTLMDEHFVSFIC